METETETATNTDVVQFVCFKLADEEYAINIKDIQEVIKVPQITPVPQMPDFVLGVVNIRGKVIPVFDFRKKFALPEKPWDNATKILVAFVDNVYISVIIDEILDNVKLPANRIDPAPSVKMKIQKSCVKGVGVLDNRMIVILDLNKIHEEINRDIAS